MKRVVIHTKDRLLAQAISTSVESLLVGYEIKIARNSFELLQRASLSQMQIYVLEVCSVGQYTYTQRISDIKRLKRGMRDVKVIFYVDEDNDVLIDLVKQARRTGVIDGFVFGCATGCYLAAVIDSL